MSNDNNEAKNIFFKIRIFFCVLKVLYALSAQSLGCNGMYYSLGGDVTTERPSLAQPLAQEL